MPPVDIQTPFHIPYTIFASIANATPSHISQPQLLKLLSLRRMPPHVSSTPNVFVVTAVAILRRKPTPYPITSDPSSLPPFPSTLQLPSLKSRLCVSCSCCNHATYTQKSSLWLLCFPSPSLATFPLFFLLLFLILLFLPSSSSSTPTVSFSPLRSHSSLLFHSLHPSHLDGGRPLLVNSPPSPAPTPAYEPPAAAATSSPAPLPSPPTPPSRPSP